MALHPEFPESPYAPLIPSRRWFAADETLRSTSYDKLLPPLVAMIRDRAHTWRQKRYAGVSATSIGLLPGGSRPIASWKTHTGRSPCFGTSLTSEKPSDGPSVTVAWY